MKSLTLLIACLIAIQSFAQTDIIELRSRNASLKKYAHIRTSEGDHVTSNFGVLAMEEVKNSLLDSVVLLSDSVAIMYTSQYCTGFHREYEPHRERQPNFYNPRIGTLWKPGADTVVNHPLFRHRHSLDSVKMVLDRDYHFNHPADSVKFIGFDNDGVNVNQQQNQQEIEGSPSNQGQKRNSAPFGWLLLLTILGPLAIVATIGQFVAPNSSN